MATNTTPQVIDLVAARRNTYGIVYESRHVYRVTGYGVHDRTAPHRVSVWSNTGRPNPHPGQRRFTAYGSIGGPGQYLDPNNQGTDDTHSYLLDAESTIITDNGTNTGTEASGQVYADSPLQVGQLVILRYPDGALSDPFEIKARALDNPVLVPAP